MFSSLFTHARCLHRNARRIYSTFSATGQDDPEKEESSLPGASILVTGVTSPNTGLYTVTLDGAVVATLSSRRDVVSHGTTLHFATNLDTTSVHTLILTAIKGGPGEAGGLVVDSWTVHGPQGGVGFV
jgi:hypothetical protein